MVARKNAGKRVSSISQVSIQMPKKSIQVQVQVLNQQRFPTQDLSARVSDHNAAADAAFVHRLIFHVQSIYLDSTSGFLRFMTRDN